MSDFYAITIDAVALVAATAKTVIELGTAATARARLVEWSVEFDGVTATAVPVKVEFQRASAAVTTATTYTTADTRFDPGGPNPQSVVKHSTTTEGAGTLSSGEIHRVPPTSGLIKTYPLGQEWIVPVSAFWRIRCTAAAGVNVTATLIWKE